MLFKSTAFTATGLLFFELVVRQKLILLFVEVTSLSVSHFNRTAVRYLNI